MGKFKKMLPYLGVNVLAFYILPCFIRDTGSAMAILLMGIPLICFAAALGYGVKHQFKWLYSVAVMLLFAPTIWVFYSESAAVYILIYGGISVIGNFLGKHLGRKGADT